MPVVPTPPYNLYYPIHDLNTSVSKTLKSVFMDVETLKIDAPGFPVDNGTNGITTIIFPHVGVDFRTVTITGDDGSGSPLVMAPEGLVARWEYPTPQAGPLTVSDYKLYSTYFVGDPRDLSFDLFTYYGDPLGGNKQIRHCPLAIPLVNHSELDRQAGMGETANIYGSIAVYSSADSGGTENMMDEMKKILEATRANLPLFGQAGLQAFRTGIPRYNTYSDGGLLFEGLLDFSCFVKVK